MKEYLSKLTSQMEISLSEEQLEQFQKLYDFMIEKNRVMNLTAITDERDVVVKHFVDSISLLKYFSLEKFATIIDVGTGAGFPGIPLAIMFPDISFTLMDSLHKRIRYLEELSELLLLKNVRCIHARAEELGRDPQHREKYDVCVSRAVASLPVLLEYCIPFVKRNGYFISYKSVMAEDELLKSEKAQKQLCCTLQDKKDFSIPDTDYNRCFLIFQKEKEMSKRYPRQNGIPKKNPII